MTTIIRIEHPDDGKGMFTHKNRRNNYHTVYEFCKRISNRHNNFLNVAVEFEKEFIQGEHYCAYKSIDQIQQWIMKDEFKILFKHKFKVLMIDVSECIVGEYQVIYKKEHILQTKDISELFN